MREVVVNDQNGLPLVGSELNLTSSTIHQMSITNPSRGQMNLGRRKGGRGQVVVATENQLAVGLTQQQ